MFKAGETLDGRVPLLYRAKDKGMYLRRLESRDQTPSVPFRFSLRVQVLSNGSVAIWSFNGGEDTYSSAVHRFYEEEWEYRMSPPKVPYFDSDRFQFTGIRRKNKESTICVIARPYNP